MTPKTVARRLAELAEAWKVALREGDDEQGFQLANAVAADCGRFLYLHRMPYGDNDLHWQTGPPIRFGIVSEMTAEERAELDPMDDSNSMQMGRSEYWTEAFYVAYWSLSIPWLAKVYHGDPNPLCVEWDWNDEGTSPRFHLMDSIPAERWRAIAFKCARLFEEMSEAIPLLWPLGFKLDAYANAGVSLQTRVIDAGISEAGVTLDISGFGLATTPVEEPIAIEGPGYDDPKMEERDRWIYENRWAGMRNPQIIVELGKIFVDRGWEPLTTEESIRNAVKRYRLNTGAPPLENTKGGRPNTQNRQTKSAN